MRLVVLERLLADGGQALALAQIDVAVESSESLRADAGELAALCGGEFAAVGGIFAHALESLLADALHAGGQRDPRGIIEAVETAVADALNTLGDG